MTIKGIFDYITTVDVCVFEDILKRQIKLNKDIAEIELKENDGANAGKTLNICRLAKDGMRETDIEILKIMIEE
jgi:L-cysteine desulfidase